jgi:hypothetical protein
MTEPPSESVGYFKYQGEGVDRGVIDARSGGLALIGIDECVRHFAGRENPALAKYSYELPVKTQEGSWEVWVFGVAALFAGPYIKKAAEQMAENDFKEVGLKDVIKVAVTALVCLVELIKHRKGSLDLSKAKIHWNLGKGEAAIENDAGEPLVIPAEFIKWFSSLPSNALKNITYAVKHDVTLTIGVETTGGNYLTTTIKDSDKHYFGYPEDEEPDDYLFPELRHGEAVVLQGRLTRGNEHANSLGLEYDGHILNCVPEVGNINRYKPVLFSECIVQGTITRFPRGGSRPERKPTVIIANITPIKNTPEQYLLER